MTDTIGFILDNDGTLIDSTGIVRRIQEKIMIKFNIVLTPERTKELEEYAEGMFQENYSTALAVGIMWNLMKEVGMTLPQRLRALLLAAIQYIKELKNLKLFDGVEELFKFFDKNSIKYAIVTSSSDRSVRQYLKNYPMFYARMRSRIITKNSVKHVKPHREPLEKASEIMGVPIEKIVVVGDTKYDILFGKSAGLVTIGVLTGIYTEEILKEYNPDFIFDSIADIPYNFEKIKERIILKTKSL